MDFWDFLQTVLDRDGKHRPEGDFAVVGGETTGEPLEPGGTTNIEVAFTPQASDPDDQKPRKQTVRSAKFAIVDGDGAVAGSFELQGKARPSSHDVLDEAESDEIKSTVRHHGRPQPPAPKTYAEMRRHLMAARDLLATLPGDTRPRVQLHLDDAKVLRWDPRRKSYIYEVRVVARDATGKEIWSGKMYATWHAQLPGGDLTVKRPPQLERPPGPGWQVPS